MKSLRVHVVTFCTPEYETAMYALRRSVFEVFGDDGTATFFAYRPDHPYIRSRMGDLPTRHPRGYGAWAWKPHVLMHALTKGAPAGTDVLLYCDADQVLTAIPTLAIAKAFEVGGGALFYVGEALSGGKDYSERLWTLPKVFKAMGVDPMDTPQIASGVQIWTMRGRHTRALLEAFAAVDQSLFMDDPVPNAHVTHRHVQSVLSVLVKSRGCEGVWVGPCTSQWGAEDRAAAADPDNIQDQFVICTNADTRTRPPPRATVITPVGPGTTPDDLCRCLASVQRQTYENVEHVIVFDGPESIVELPAAVRAGRRPVVTLTLPYNTGGGGWNGHRIYAGLPFLLPGSAYFLYLDSDNWITEDHVESLVETATAGSNRWSWCLRNIYDRSGLFVARDTVESLGPDTPTKLGQQDRLIDTGCYCLSREVATSVGVVWNSAPSRPAPPAREVDRALCQLLAARRDVWPGAGTGRYTLNYVAGNTVRSVRPEFFAQTPTPTPASTPASTTATVYLAHLTPDATAKALTLCGGTTEPVERAFDEWNPLLPWAIQGRARNAFTAETFEPGSVVLFVLFHPAHLDLTRLLGLAQQSAGVKTVLWTVEGPNIRHRGQWTRGFLDQFDRVLTYFVPALEGDDPRRRYQYAPYPYRFTDVQAGLARWTPRTVHAGPFRVCMVLENRDLAGEYGLWDGTVRARCLDQFRRQYVDAFRARGSDMIKPIGRGWAGAGKFHDTKTVLDHAAESGAAFYLVVENTDAPGYVSEKVFDGLVAGCVPIFHGCSLRDVVRRCPAHAVARALVDLADAGGMILAEDFDNDPDRVARHVSLMGVKEIDHALEVVSHRRAAVLELVTPARCLLVAETDAGASTHDTLK